MSARLELPLQLRMVVDLAVLRCPDRAILVADGLMSTLRVDDAETLSADRDSRALVSVGSVVVRPAQPHGRVHPGHAGARGVLGAATDTAHAVRKASAETAYPATGGAY